LTRLLLCWNVMWVWVMLAPFLIHTDSSRTTSIRLPPRSFATTDGTAKS
jgi:hypothetical protein